MDAREYMAKKGLDGERDQERPNTLEEKAWSRALEAGGQRPKAGTPFDWEEWERYHDTLAEGADELDQKINHEAHRRPSARSTDSSTDKSVQHFTPSSGAKAGQATPAEAAVEPPAGDERTAPPDVRHASSATPPAPRVVLHALAVLMPPLAVGFSRGGGRRLAASLVLTLLGWLPGIVHAVWWLRRAST